MWREFAKAEKIEVTKIKTLLILFFDSRGAVHQKFVCERHTVNASFHRDILDRLSKHIAHNRPNLWKSRPIFLLHDNALAHNVTTVQQFLA